MRHLIFVDDEPNVLRGLRRVLRRHAGSWEMSFAEGGPEALEIAAAGPVDAVITDFMMPGMDGADVCRAFRTTYPGTVRILLTGNAPAEAMAKAEGLAHRLLAKPCPPERVRETIESACAALDVLPAEARIGVGGTMFLPSAPERLATLAAACSAAVPDLEVVADLVAGDPALAAKALKLRHAGFFGGAEMPVIAQTAARMLGVETLVALVQGSTFACGPAPDVAAAIDVVAEGVRSLRLAADAAARAEAAETSAAVREVAAIAGGLEPVGRLLAAAWRPEAWTALPPESDRSRRIAAEVEAFGTTVAELGTALLGAWGLPRPVLEALDGRGADARSAAGFVAAAAQAIGDSDGRCRDDARHKRSA